MKINENSPLLPISVASRLTGITIRMLREYEKENFIKPQRMGGRRLFSHNEINFIEDIKFYLKERKMSIAGLKEFYLRTPCWEIKRCGLRKCPAYGNLAQKCWEIAKHHKKCNITICPSCPIYLVNTTQKKKIPAKGSLSPTVYPRK